MRTFKSAKKRAKKSAFTNKSAQKSTLKSTFGSSEPIWKRYGMDDSTRRITQQKQTLDEAYSPPGKQFTQILKTCFTLQQTT